MATCSSTVSTWVEKVGLPGCESGIERDAGAVTEQVDFGAEACHRSSQRVVARLGGAVRPTFFRPSSGALGRDDRARERPLLPFDLALGIQFGVLRLDVWFPADV